MENALAVRNNSSCGWGIRCVKSKGTSWIYMILGMYKFEDVQMECKIAT